MRELSGELHNRKVRLLEDHNPVALSDEFGLDPQKHVMSVSERTVDTNVVESEIKPHVNGRTLADRAIHAAHLERKHVGDAAHDRVCDRLRIVRTHAEINYV